MGVTLLVADDQEIVRNGLAVLLRREPGVAHVYEAADGLAAVAAVAAHRPDVVLMDLKMPRLDGVAACAEVTALDVGTRTIVLTNFGGDAMVYRALRAGASGFLLKDAPVQRIIAAVHVVVAGDALVEPGMTRQVVDRYADRAAVAPFHTLTERERQVLTEVGTGASNAEIAARLHIAVTTVRTHLGDKLGTRDRVHLVVAAYESGLVLPSSIR